MDSGLAGFSGSDDVREAVFLPSPLAFVFLCEIILSFYRQGSSR